MLSSCISIYWGSRRPIHRQSLRSLPLNLAYARVCRSWTVRTPAESITGASCRRFRERRKSQGRPTLPLRGNIASD